MKITQIDDVELISIKTKSLQDLDNEINFNLNINDKCKNKYVCINNFNDKTPDKEYDVYTKPNQAMKEEQEENKECDDDHYESSVRYLTIDKSPNGACGFHLTRTKWDPYPWVSAVDNFTPAAKSDLKAGDCVLEVNGCDVLGLRITEIAKLVKSSQQQVTLLLWSSNCNSKCDQENLCAAPMPRSLQRLSLVVQTILSLIECPVCLDTITPPAMQCQNGHLLCVDCRIRAEKCPVCRDRYFPRPALIAEQIQSAITSAFNLCRNEDKVRQKIFGRHHRQREMVKNTLECLQQQKQQQQQQEHQQLHKSFRTYPLTEDEEINSTTITANTSEAKKIINGKCDRNEADKFSKSAGSSSSSIRNRATCNKFLTKFLNSKAYSMGNLSNIQSNTATKTTNNFNTCYTSLKSAISQFELLDMQKQEQQGNSFRQVGERTGLFKDFPTDQQYQQKSSVTNTNQFNDSPRNGAKHQQYLLTHKLHLDTNENDLNLNTKLCCQQIFNNKMKPFSLSTTQDLTNSKDSITCLLDSSRIFINGKINIPSSTTVVYETSYATIPRAIKVMQERY